MMDAAHARKATYAEDVIASGQMAAFKCPQFPYDFQRNVSINYWIHQQNRFNTILF
jgi:hypothetical protein